jgi:Domain of unknown function (DUF4159)/Aerotolerance regulator N-terminal
MSFGAFAFLNPWLLGALVTLPLIYWLLRTIPPRPRQVAFPATRILVGIENREKTPSKTPWWLLLIRLLAAALVIAALAEPVINPARDVRLAGTGPVVIAVDNGWASADQWAARQEQISQVISEAEAQSRPVVVMPTAASEKTVKARIEAPADARSTAAGIVPQPFAPARKQALLALETALNGAVKDGISAVWLTDGLDHAGEGSAFATGLNALTSGGTLALVQDPGGREPMGLLSGLNKNGKLLAKVMRSGGPARQGSVHALSAKGQRLGEVDYTFASGETVKDVTFELPLELRNQVTRIEIAAEASAGAVNLLDGRSQWQRVGLLSGESQEQSQPLLAPLYFLKRAVQPFAEVIEPKDPNLAQGVDSALQQNASVLLLADIGTLSGDVKDKLETWVKKGGILVRFAGPRLEKGGDELLPVALRTGGRSLGGALSWSTPQPLNTFDDASPFAGLTIPTDVLVNRQVLADPSRLTPDVQVWARLKDGTPLVTAAARGDGKIVLFHTTGNSDWSNLPISGLFVDMLQRITQLGGFNAPASAPASDGSAAPAVATTDATTPGVLLALQTLDGFGVLRAPPPTAQAISAADVATAAANLDHPPGYYGAAGLPRTINVLNEKTVLAPLSSLPARIETRSYEAGTSWPLKPWLLAATLALIFADIIAVLVLQAGGLPWRLPRPEARSSQAAALVAVFAAATLSVALPQTAHAQSQEGATATPPAAAAAPPRADIPAFAVPATSKITLGYVLTGDQATDDVSRLGLAGLSRILEIRSSVEPGDPIGVDVTTDEIAFFPVLYWPVLKNPKPLPEAALAKIDAYMKQGGLIVFDTRDYQTGLPTGIATAGETGPALQQLLGRLDLPPLEPVPEGHVLTKSFYLLHSFPGRWDGGQLWVEAQSGGESDEGGRKARRADGVTSVMVTSNDLAAAWALDKRGKPLFAAVPGGERQREMAFRTGVNIVMHALTGNYKADQVHVPALLERLGQ